MVIQHREANGSVLSFLARLTNPRTLERCPPGSGALLQQHFLPRAPMLVRLLLSGISGTLSPGRVPDLAAALLGVLGSGPGGPQEGLGWLMAALQVGLRPPACLAGWLACCPSQCVRAPHMHCICSGLQGAYVFA